MLSQIGAEQFWREHDSKQHREIYDEKKKQLKSSNHAL